MSGSHHTFHEAMADIEAQLEKANATQSVELYRSVRELRGRNKIGEDRFRDGNQMRLWAK